MKFAKSLWLSNYCPLKNEEAQWRSLEYAASTGFLLIRDIYTYIDTKDKPSFFVKNLIWSIPAKDFCRKYYNGATWEDRNICSRPQNACCISSNFSHFRPAPTRYLSYCIYCIDFHHKFNRLSWSVPVEKGQHGDNGQFTHFGPVNFSLWNPSDKFLFFWNIDPFQI